MENIDDQVEKIFVRMFKRRLSQSAPTLESWTREPKNKLEKPRDTIRRLIKEGKKVTSGYYTTGCRSFHDFAIFYK
jgi:hypothetical protein